MKFSDIIGNNSAKERIRQMIDSDKFPHALLIHGLPGIPKLSLARAAAQYLQCTNRMPLMPTASVIQPRRHLLFIPDCEDW